LHLSATSFEFCGNPAVRPGGLTIERPRADLTQTSFETNGILFSAGTEFEPKKAFGAEEIMRMPGPGGNIMRAEVKIGDSRIMLADEMAAMGCKGPETRSVIDEKRM
jgi:hypothetical protein